MIRANRLRNTEFDDLLDAAPVPANDVDPPLRGLPQWALSATVSLASEDCLYAGLSYDMSSGGVFVATFDPPPIGARVNLSLTLYDGSEFVVRGIVRWVRTAAISTDGLPAGCGIEPKGLPVHALRALELLAQLREPVLWLAEIG
jgi:Tfp pilus assembly protein PilZ